MEDSEQRRSQPGQEQEREREQEREQERKREQEQEQERVNPTQPESLALQTTLAPPDFELPSIYICCPSWGKISTATVVNLLQAAVCPNLRIYLPETSFPSSATFNEAAKRMLVDEEELGNHWDYLFFIDGDIASTRISLPRALHRLIKAGKDIISASTPTWRKSPTGNIFPLPTAGFLNPDDPTGLSFVFKDLRGLRKVDVVGMAFTLIRREVLEALSPAPFRYRFLDEWKTDRMTPDYDFCLRAQEQGFEVWCDFDLRVSHFKSVDLLWVVESFARFFTQVEEQILRAIKEQGLENYDPQRVKFELE